MPLLSTSLASAPRWAVLAGIGTWTVLLHALHLVLLAAASVPAHRGPVVASLVVWLALTVWAVARRSRLGGAELSAAFALGAVAITADGVWGSSPGHPYLVSAGLVALVLGNSVYGDSRWHLAGGAVVLACQAWLLLALLGTDPLGVYTALTVVITSAGASLMIEGVRRELQSLAESAAHAAAHDPLTGLLNRRGMADRFSGLRASAPAGHRAAAVVLDLDHFKRINDVHGHDVGDEVLVLVAGVLRARARRDDLVVRLGGEELAWLGAWPSPEDAVRAAEGLRRALASSPAPADLRITASIGVASASDATQACPDPEALSRLLVRADAALYAAKAAGRDRVVLSAAGPGAAGGAGHDGAPAPRVRDGGSGRAGAGGQRA